MITLGQILILCLWKPLFLTNCLDLQWDLLPRVLSLSISSGNGCFGLWQSYVFNLPFHNSRSTNDKKSTDQPCSNNWLCLLRSRDTLLSRNFRFNDPFADYKSDVLRLCYVYTKAAHPRRFSFAALSRSPLPSIIVLDCLRYRFQFHADTHGCGNS